MTTYKRLNDMDGVDRGAVLRNQDGLISVIPNCSDNRDYQEYLAWVADGNTADPA